MRADKISYKEDTRFLPRSSFLLHHALLRAPNKRLAVRAVMMHIPRRLHPDRVELVRSLDGRGATRVLRVQAAGRHR